MGELRPPRQVHATVHTPCPKCGNYFVDDDAIWVWNARFYCSEECCRSAANG